jgi:3'-phosphoadenosine 5'-phosphosulfate sulfotransferase (PAPS reductase)/FAD synthetase
MSYQFSLSLDAIASALTVFDPAEFHEAAIRVIQKHYLNPGFGAVAVASSFGKDSTLVTLLAFEAVRTIEGKRPRQQAACDHDLEHPHRKPSGRGDGDGRDPKD